MRTPRPRDHGRDIDQELLNLTLSLSPSERFQRWLTTHEFMIALRLASLREQYPDLSERDLMLKTVESFSNG
jgi:hypothetical protein